MPLRGKFINAYNSDIQDILANREAATLIQNLGVGILDSVDLKKSRYGKVIIFSDSDEDGKDIACQLIAFFAKVMPPILTEGMLYLAIPPLYGTTVKGEFIPIYTESSKETHLSKGHYVQRYKGLGEMSASQLKVTSLDKDTRSLIHITIDPTSLYMIERIMGGESSYRRDLLLEMGVLREWPKQ
jgi:topoisomerase-4 subunit B